MRVIGAGEACTANETALDWNQQGPAGPVGPPGPAGPQGLQGPAAPRLLARLDADGNILAASSTVRPDGTGKFTNPALDAGQYEVHFNQSVVGCIAVASVHDPRTNIFNHPVPGYATTWFTSSTQVGVNTFAADGTPTDMSFDVIVVC